MKKITSFILGIFAISLVIGSLPSPVEASLQEQVSTNIALVERSYAYPQRWANGNITVLGYTDATIHSLVQQGLDEWEAASGGYFSFSYSYKGHIAGTSCDDIVPEPQQVVLCSCPFLTETPNGAKCANTGDPNQRWAGNTKGALDEAGNLNGAVVLLRTLDWEGGNDDLLCHEFGHMAGLDHPAPGTDSCMELQVPAPTALDAATLQAKLKEPPKVKPQPEKEKKKDKKKKKGKGKKGGKGKRRH